MATTLFFHSLINKMLQAQIVRGLKFFDLQVAASNFPFDTGQFGRWEFADKSNYPLRTGSAVIVRHSTNSEVE